MKASLGARLIGSVRFDAEALHRDVETIIAARTQPCADGVGEWAFAHLWYGDAAAQRGDGDRVRRSVPYLDRLVTETFIVRHVVMVRVFMARAGGYVRPHRDWTGARAAFTRVHLPLRTSDGCFNSEDGALYRMREGEIWFLDGSRVHSGACFSAEPRLHLVVDFEPGVPLRALFRDRRAYRPARETETLPRTALGAAGLAAIHDLGSIATGANVERIADLLGTVHFERDVNAAAAYDWLAEIARRSGDRMVTARADELRQGYLGAPDDR